jgi:hypothetical protein
LALVVLGSVLSASVLAYEIEVDRVVSAARSALLGLQPARENAQSRALADCEDTRDERVLVACLSGIAGLARSSSEPAIKAREIARGRRGAARVGTQIPQSGETLTAIALLESSADDAGAQERAIAALTKSYRSAPYLRKSGLWRLWYAGHHWDALAPQTRRAVLAEAVWYGTLGKTDRDAVVSALFDTPAFVRMLIRLPGAPGENLPLPQMPE